MTLPGLLTPHKVTVKAFAGEGANGPIFETPQVVEGVYVEEVHELVLNNDGAEVVSKGKVFFNLTDAPSEGSLITTWAGTVRERESVAFRVSIFDHPNAASHAVAYLR